MNVGPELLLRQAVLENARQREEIERLRAALWPFAMTHRIKAGYCADDFRRASDCFPAEPVIIHQQQAGQPK